MILWSKGLGKLVLNMRLSERSGMTGRGDRVVIDGTMGPPTFWDYSVDLGERDVVDFIDLLKNPTPVRFLVSTPKRWSILAAALAGIGCFVWRTLVLFLGGKPGVRRLATPAASSDSAADEQESGSAHGGT
jgi:hypothetical protein